MLGKPEFMNMIATDEERYKWTEDSLLLPLAMHNTYNAPTP
jgi:hypothetical protein